MSFTHYKSIKSREARLHKTHLSISVQPTLEKGDFFARQITLEVDDFENEIKTTYLVDKKLPCIKS
jgi:hypothetical protein